MMEVFIVQIYFNFIVLFLSLFIIIYLYIIKIQNEKKKYQILREKEKTTNELKQVEQQIKEIYESSLDYHIYSRFKPVNYITFLFEDYLYHSVYDMKEFNDLHYEEREVLYEKLIILKNNIINGTDSSIEYKTYRLFKFVYDYEDIVKLKPLLNNISYHKKDENIIKFNTEYQQLTQIINEKYSMKEYSEMMKSKRETLILKRKNLIKKETELSSLVKRFTVAKINYLLPLVILILNIIISFIFIIIY